MAGRKKSAYGLLRRGSWSEASRISGVLRRETVGGTLILAAAVIGLGWANAPWSGAYDSLRSHHVGPHSLGLHLSLAEWAADGLLAVFFFVAGLELKREFVAGDLREPRRAMLPIIATLGGVLVPAALYLAVNSVGGGSPRGWAIPTATDIAFALAVLAVLGQHLPSTLRTFLLTLAVIDDLIAIAVIACFYTDQLVPLPLVLALVPLAVFATVVRRGLTSWWLLLPAAAATWTLVHASGVHATVAGILLSFTVPVAARRGPNIAPTAGGMAGIITTASDTPDRAASTRTPTARAATADVAERLERRVHPFSAGVAVPVFAFFAAGVTVTGLAGLSTALTDPVTLGVMAGLLVGKPLGIVGATWLTCRLTRCRLDQGFTWADVIGLGVLAGIGFTVSLLVGELAFGPGSEHDDHARLAVLASSLTAATVAGVILRLRNGVYRRINLEETVDADHDGVPDAFQPDHPPGDDPSGTAARQGRDVTTDGRPSVSR